MPRQKQGTVYIVDLLADFPDGPLAEGGHRYTGYWDIYTGPDDPDEIEQGPGWDDAEEAIRWGRERAPTVIIRIDGQTHSAGDQHPEDESVLRWESG
jgi:hypothetical protein